MFGPHWREEISITVGTWVLKYVINPIASFGNLIVRVALFIELPNDNDKHEENRSEAEKSRD